MTDEETGALQDRIGELEALFELRHDADMRAIARWREATGKTMTLPDHADLCVWLMAMHTAEEPGDAYLIWSHKYGQWWAQGRLSYANDLNHAGHYAHSSAITLTATALLRSGDVPSDIPVRAQDMLTIQKMIRERFGKKRIGGI
jgi:hypothetical protein